MEEGRKKGIVKTYWVNSMAITKKRVVEKFCFFLRYVVL